MPETTGIVRRPEHMAAGALAPGVTAAEMLNDEHGCRGLHQRRLRFSSGAALTGTAGCRGEAWYVISGSGVLEADGGGTAGSAEAAGTVQLRPGTAVWLSPALGYRARAGAGDGAGTGAGAGAVAGADRAGDLEILVIIVRAEAGEGPALHVTTLEESLVERTGDREFRVLLSAGLSITQFAGLIPPGRAPEHHHTYDEVVHVLAGQGVVHLSGGQIEIGPGTSIYLPPYQPHCLENTGSEPLRILGVFYPAGSPAAKQAT
ncbi:MAG TPA: cupin domain-containing protein [Streptosporangiaceae bacterium]|nr:cupin domain-containing protein [Streptosporangiaceae bacterium]